MVDLHGRFVWYELLTTDMAIATTFYSSVMGWGARDASTADLAYTLFRAGKRSVSGLMELPEDARKKGATPRWVGYVNVNDVDAAAERIKRLGGMIYVPPTNTNIGRIAVVADPQSATLALVNGLKHGERQPHDPAKAGHVGWHELLAADSNKVFGFYRELFGWQKAEADIALMDSYQLFAAGGQTIGGLFTKLPQVPFPFWLYYFNVGDLDKAAERVRAGGGQVFQGPIELSDSNWMARCIDPLGAMFALQGTRRATAMRHAPVSDSVSLGWSTGWDGISSKGRLVVRKPEADSKPKSKT
jgi:predicted enzyme related to lactoylglutathione lyase